MASPTINSARCIVVNLDNSDAAYYDKTPTTVDYIASCCKLMTVYVAMNDYFDTKTELEAEDVTITAADVAAGGTGANLAEDDVWSLWDLVLDIMFPSSNDACLALARDIGTRIYVDAGSTGNTGVTRFVERMNAVASALGMDDTTYVSPHGLDTGNTTTAEDMATFARAAGVVLSNSDLRDVFRYHTVTVSYDRSGAQTLEIYKGVVGEVVPGYRMSKLGIGGGTHLWGVYEIPNGQEIFIQTIDTTTATLAVQDHLTLYRELLTDYAGTLGTPGSPATPEWVASDLSCNMIVWNPDDADTTMYQDDGTSTPADAASDLVRRWYPSTEVGVSGNYLRNGDANDRPQRDADGLIDYSADTTAILDLGDTGFGNTDFFAQASESFMLLMYTQGCGTNGTLFARRHTSNLADIQFYYDGDTFGGGIIRRFSKAWSPSVNGANRSGEEAVHGAMWDGTSWSWVADGIGRPGFVTAGTGADLGSTSTLTFGAQNYSSYPWEGKQGRTVMTDAADIDRLRQLYAWCMGVTMNQFRDATGAAPAAGMTPIPPLQRPMMRHMLRR